MTLTEALSGIPRQSYPKVSTRRVHVTIDLTTGARISGDLHVKPGGLQSRVTDMLNVTPADFLPITNAIVSRPDGAVHTTQCAIVARQQIAMLLADD